MNVIFLGFATFPLFQCLTSMVFVHFCFLSYIYIYVNRYNQCMSQSHASLKKLVFVETSVFGKIALGQKSRTNVFQNATKS